MVSTTIYSTRDGAVCHFVGGNRHDPLNPGKIQCQIRLFHFKTYTPSVEGLVQGCQKMGVIFKLVNMLGKSI